MTRSSRRPPRLPPPPPPPRSKPTYVPETLTGKSSARMRIYASLLATFDALDDTGRLDLAELAGTWAESSAADRKLVLELARRLNNR